MAPVRTVRRDDVVVTALHVFDMDGTLLRETTANLEISRHLDRLVPMRDLEARFAAGEIDEHTLSTGVCRLWHDLDQDGIDRAAAAAPWIAGMDEVLADIRERGEVSMVVTMSPEFFARYLHRRGVDVIYGAAFPPFPLVGPVDPAGLLTPHDKVRFLEQERTRRGLAAGVCVAYGDSVSDEPLFAHLENTVAVNASPRLEATARAIHRGNDLRTAYARGRALLSAPRR